MIERLDLSRRFPANSKVAKGDVLCRHSCVKMVINFGRAIPPVTERYIRIS